MMKTYIYKNDAIFYEGTCEKGCDGMITGQGSLFDTNNKNVNLQLPENRLSELSENSHYFQIFLFPEY